MKYTILLSLFLFSSCGIFAPIEPVDLLPKLNYFHNYYKVKSTARTFSDFAVLKRSVEFDFARVKEGIKIQCMLTTGLNEGPLQNVFIIGLDSLDVKIGFTALESKEYVEHIQYSKTSTVASTSTITDPGGTDIVVDADGKHKTVTRPTSTKTVTTQTPQTTHYDKNKTQYFNSGIVMIPNEQLQFISNSNNVFFTVESEKAIIQIIPSRKQMQELRGLFRVDVMDIF